MAKPDMVSFQIIRTLRKGQGQPVPCGEIRASLGEAGVGIRWDRSMRLRIAKASGTLEEQDVGRIVGRRGKGGGYLIVSPDGTGGPPLLKDRRRDRTERRRRADSIRHLMVVTTLRGRKEPVPGREIGSNFRKAGLGLTWNSSVRGRIVTVSEILERWGVGRIVGHPGRRGGYSLISPDGARIP